MLSAEKSKKYKITASLSISKIRHCKSPTVLYLYLVHSPHCVLFEDRATGWQVNGGWSEKKTP